MDEISILLNMTLLLLVAGACSIIFKKLKMPAIIGYLVAGIVLANFWVGESEDTDTIVGFLSSIGLILLMFVIGMEFNLKKLRKTGGFAIMVALVQLPLMILGGYLFGMMMGWDPIQSILFGAIISGSSTAVVTAILKDQGKLSKEDVDTIILITVVEDVAQVLILSMASPLLTGSAMDMDGILWMLMVILIFMVAAVVIGILLVPKALDWLASKMPDEILLIVSLGMCFGMALLSVWIGMSMAIGAFLMGVVVSQANSRSTIEHDITPMKDVFMAMFFISVGLEISINGIVDNIWLILIIFLVYALLKASTVFLAYFVGNRPMRIGFMSAVSLVAMGEFAFIIAKAGYDAGVVTESFYTAVIGAALVSMIALPLLSKNSSKICDVAHDRAPKPLLNAVGTVERIRDSHYSKLSLASKSMSARVKTRATAAYMDVLFIAAIEIMFLLLTPDITNFIHHNMSFLSFSMCYTIVLLVNFVVVAIPLYDLIKNLKFVEKVFIDAERKAEEKGEGDLQRRSIRFHKAFVRINNWVLVFLIDFLILIVVPSNVGLMEHVYAMIGGIAIILVIYAYKRNSGQD